MGFDRVGEEELRADITSGAPNAMWATETLNFFWVNAANCADKPNQFPFAVGFS